MTTPYLICLALAVFIVWVAWAWVKRKRVDPAPVERALQYLDRDAAERGHRMAGSPCDTYQGYNGPAPESRPKPPLAGKPIQTGP